ncbi:hypothetical protein JOD67_002577 [Tenggerimyces flavus]|nr:hypothetical protein [Tenggerimyces flavus]
MLERWVQSRAGTSRTRVSRRNDRPGYPVEHGRVKVGAWRALRGSAAVLSGDAVLERASSPGRGVRPSLSGRPRSSVVQLPSPPDRCLGAIELSGSWGSGVRSPGVGAPPRHLVRQCPVGVASRGSAAVLFPRAVSERSSCPGRGVLACAPREWVLRLVISSASVRSASLPCGSAAVLFPRAVSERSSCPGRGVLACAPREWVLRLVISSASVRSASLPCGSAAVLFPRAVSERSSCPGRGVLACAPREWVLRLVISSASVRSRRSE